MYSETVDTNSTLAPVGRYVDEFGRGRRGGGYRMHKILFEYTELCRVATHFVTVV